jgi:hypothetical protein
MRKAMIDYTVAVVAEQDTPYTFWWQCVAQTESLESVSVAVTTNTPYQRRLKI